MEGSTHPLLNDSVFSSENKGHTPANHHISPYFVPLSILLDRGQFQPSVSIKAQLANKYVNFSYFLSALVRLRGRANGFVLL